MQVLSADLNNWQNRIVDCHRERTKCIIEAYPDVDGSDNPTWAFTMATTFGWTCNIYPNGSLYVPIHGQEGFRLKDVEVKFYGGGVTAPTISLYQPVPNHDISATAPAQGSVIATDHTTAHNGVWVNISMTPTSAPEIYSDDDLVILEVYPGQTGDRVASVRATFEPITPTP
jgi:hypothetical protein